MSGFFLFRRNQSVPLQSRRRDLCLIAGAFALALLVAAEPLFASEPSPASPRADETGKPVFTIGVEETLDPWFFVQTFAPTMEHLRKSLPDTTIQTELMSQNALLDAADERRIDALISTSGLYAFARNEVGAQHVATRRQPLATNPARATGAVILVRSESGYRSIGDLRGKSVVAMDEGSFDGWHVALGELLHYTDDPEHFFSETKFTHYTTPAPVSLLLAGDADAAVVKMCDLERYLQTRTLSEASLSRVRVLSPKVRESDEARCLRSTDVYPELVFSTLSHADPEIVERVARALLFMPEKDGDWHWGLSNSFGSVDKLYRSLKIGPYEYLRQTGWRYWLETYRQYLFIVAGVILFVLIHIVRTNRLVTLRTAQLRETLAAKERAEEEAGIAREKLARHDRLTIIASMSNMIVHELTQPITSLFNYTASLRLYVRDQRDDALDELCRRIDKQARRISDIVQSVRLYARGERAVHTEIDLVEAVRRAVSTFRSSTAARGVTLHESWPKGSLHLLGSALEMELLALNLLKNAAAAAKKNREETSPVVSISLAKADAGVVLTVEDNGPALSEEAFRALSEPTSGIGRESDEATDGEGTGAGLGLGLNLCRSIVEHHGLRMSFEKRSPQGVVAVVEFPQEVLK